ncbi:MAG TPA: LysR family transcriptional regulator [Bryobacteraceae bacterium]|jgi:LysR family transcriptional activator of glutamate synthase operon
MDLRHIEVFLAVMENATVTQTAERLHVSPGAITLQLQGLARELRAELFVRSGRRIVPTPQAHRFAEHAREVMKKIREIEQDFVDSAADDQRPFHFACGATTLIYRLGGPLRNLRKRFPHADVRVTVAATERIVKGLLDRSFDLGLLSLPVTQPSLTIVPLFEEELLVIRPAHDRKGDRKGDGTVSTVQPEELAAARFLLFPEESNMRAMIDRFFQELGIAPRVTMEADDVEAIKRMVEAGFGYSILPQYALGGRGRSFQKLRVPGRRLARKQALAMPKSAYPRALTLAVAEGIQAALGKLPSVERR